MSFSLWFLLLFTEILWKNRIFNELRMYRWWFQMCHDRGYLVTQDELDQSLEDFKTQYGDKPSERKPSRADLTILVAHNDDPTGRLRLDASLTISCTSCNTRMDVYSSAQFYEISFAYIWSAVEQWYFWWRIFDVPIRKICNLRRATSLLHSALPPDSVQC